MSDTKKRLNDVTPEEWDQAHTNWADKSKPAHFEKLKSTDTDDYEHDPRYYDTDRNKPLNYENADTFWDNWKPTRTIC
jgi:hypothetical protein